MSDCKTCLFHQTIAPSPHCESGEWCRMTCRPADGAGCGWHRTEAWRNETLAALREMP